ncbi:ParA family protein [Acinetobacter sp. ACNIH3]|uniref:ParA family protein n=1 Tax=Acinetobacter TaxID=469 RepID=UPI000CDD04CA|nr:MULTISPECIES: division plane positioning ATPase MipZ [Acinetobacter]POU20170.1 ParA family protein [Acinetobacter sp. ACNIH3]POV78977.1 ParA family protein [Acinetobacter sp. ACNIH4]
MTIFVVTSPKRDSGKSTLAMNLTEYLRLQARTLYIDTDDDKQNFEWVALHRTGFGFEHISLKDHPDELMRRVEQVKTQYDDIVIDIAGHDSYALRSVLMRADKLIIPMSAEAEEQEMYTEMLQLAISVAQFNTQLKVYGILMRVPQQIEISQIEANQNLLKGIPGAHFLNTIIYEDEAFDDAKNLGCSIWEHSPAQGQRFDQFIQELMADTAQPV